MELTQTSYLNIPIPLTIKRNLFVTFISWCQNQQSSRITWLAISITAHGCLITPLALLIVMSTGNNFIYWPFVIGAMTMPLVVNLAALPTKTTIPLFFLSLIVDAVVIICAVTNS